jgi:hypothetical protein
MAKKKSAQEVDEGKASAGHKLGQMVGDWLEQYFVYPLLQEVADKLRLYLDSRFRVRAARGDPSVTASKTCARSARARSRRLGVTNALMTIPTKRRSLRSSRTSATLFSRNSDAWQTESLDHS